MSNAEIVVSSEVKKVNYGTPYRGDRSLLLVEDVQEQGAVYSGRATADITERTAIVVPPSGLTGLTYAGGKCVHGVYIPATSPFMNHAPDCSICRPYEVLIKDPTKVYKA